MELRNGSQNADENNEAIYNELFCRNSLDKKEQQLISRSVFGLVGLGGVGGFVFENLVRMGAERFVIFENERFELSNLNRQILATVDNLDMEKTKVAISRAIKINPGINKENIIIGGEFKEKSSVKTCNVLIDGSDNLKTRMLASIAAKKDKIPYVFASANDSRGMVSVLIKKSLNDILKMPEESIDRIKTCSSILAPAAGVSGSVAAAQAVNVVLKKPIIEAPKFLFFDLFKSEPFWIKEI